MVTPAGVKSPVFPVEAMISLLFLNSSSAKPAWKAHFDPFFSKLTLLVTTHYYLNTIPRQDTQMFTAKCSLHCTCQKVYFPTCSFFEENRRWREADLFICCLYVCMRVGSSVFVWRCLCVGGDGGCNSKWESGLPCRLVVVAMQF